MEIEVKLNGKSLLLGGWERAGQDSSNKVRRLVPSDNFSCVGWMCSWDGRIFYDKGSFRWTPMFLGKDLHDLEKIYQSFYPDPPQFRNFQIKEAQDHMDKFIRQFNSLKIFI